jgi:hypothetical protein
LPAHRPPLTPTTTGFLSPSAHLIFDFEDQRVGGGTYFYLRSQKPFEKLQRKYQKVLNKSNDFDLVYQYLRDYYLLIHGQSLDGLALAQIKDETVQKIIQVIEEQKYSTAANKKATDLRPWLDLLKPKN